MLMSNGCSRSIVLGVFLLASMTVAGASLGAADDEPQKTGDKSASAAPVKPRSVIRLGTARSVPSTDQAPVAPDDSSSTAQEETASPEPSAAPGRIQPHNPKPVAGDVKKLIDRAYKLSESADSEDDYTQIVTLCQQAASLASEKEVVAYLNRLAAWAYDHRGQDISQQAAELAGSGKTAEALALERRALTDFDYSVKLDPDRWRAVHNRGVSYALLGKDRYERALKDFDQTIQLQPNFYKAWFNRAEIRRELGEHEDALADYTQSLRLKPDDVLARRGRGHTFYQMGQHGRALEDFTRVVQLSPEDTIAWVDRADLRSEMKQWESAASDYQQALKLDSECGRAYLGAAWLMATCPDKRFRNPKTSVRAAEKAVELDGAKDHYYLDTLAAAYANAGMFAEAKAAAEQALQIAPTEAKTAVKNRLVLYEQEQPFHQPPRNVRPAGGAGR
jgi:tetratricopeptide (TPR) repeat protein